MPALAANAPAASPIRRASIGCAPRLLNGEIARKVALKLKYSGRPGVARTIARFMERHVDAEADSILIPVPLHRWRIWRRGYTSRR